MRKVGIMVDRLLEIKTETESQKFYKPIDITLWRIL